MPTPMMMSLAKKAKCSIQQVERAWDEAKEIAAANKIDPRGPKYWGYVTSVTKRKLGLPVNSVRESFKEWLELLREQDEAK